MNPNHKMAWTVMIPALCLVLVIVGVSAASSVSVPNTFTGGTPAVAAEVNANFSAVENAINDNDSRVTALEGALGGLTASNLVRGFTDEDTGFIDDFDDNLMTAIHDTSVNAPVDGILLIWAQACAEWDNTNPNDGRFVASFRITVDGNEAAGAVQEQFEDPPTNNDQRIISLTAAVPVTAGSLAVALEALTPGIDANKIFFTERSITTLFVPFGNSGIQGQLD